MRALIAGWFSFEQMGATAGDVMARDVVAGWVRECGLDFDIAVAPPFEGGVNWQTTDPGRYSHVIFVCGPFGNGEPLTGFLDRFRGLALIGVDVSMLDPIAEWNPFTHLIERDSSRRTHPDVAFLSTQSATPVVGLCLVHPQPEYKERVRHQQVNDAVRRLLDRKDVAVVPIDTRLDENVGGLGNARQIESLIAKMDLVVTTRLHGLVLAIKNGVPALAVDAIAGGAKLAAQARTIEWPALFMADEFSDADLDRAFDYCLSREARTQALESRRIAFDRLARARAELVDALNAKAQIF